MHCLIKTKSSNFTHEELEVFKGLMDKYRGTLFNPKIDAATSQHKMEVWHNIEKEYNANASVTFRTLQQLKYKFMHLKRNATIERRKSISGSNAAQSSDTSKWCQKRQASLAGLQSSCNSDSQVHSSQEVDSKILSNEAMDEIPSIFDESFVFAMDTNSDATLDDGNPTDSGRKSSRTSETKTNKREVTPAALRASLDEMAKRKKRLLQLGEIMMKREEERKTEIHQLTILQMKELHQLKMEQMREMHQTQMLLNEAQVTRIKAEIEED